MELTDSGKFIEVEREATEKPVENGNGNGNVTGNGTAKDNEDQKDDTDLSTIDNDDSMRSEIKSITASPSQSPGKTVRIKENGAKMNGDSEVRFCVDFY